MYLKLCPRARVIVIEDKGIQTIAIVIDGIIEILVGGDSQQSLLGDRLYLDDLVDLC